MDSSYTLEFVLVHGGRIMSWDGVVGGFGISRKCIFCHRFTGTALIHSLLNYKSTGQHRDWTLLLSILTFSFSLIGTFLVRSGILTSVHSFASDPQRGLWILIILSFFIFFHFLFFYVICKKRVKKKDFVFLRRGTFILINNYLLMVSVIVIFFGMMYPLLLECNNWRSHYRRSKIF